MNKDRIKFVLAIVISFLRNSLINVRYRLSVVAQKFAFLTKKYSIICAHKLSASSKKFASFIKNSIINLAYKTKDRLLADKKKTAIGVATVCAFAICSLTAFNLLTGFEYSYEGQALGVVDEPECVYNGIEKAEKELTRKVGAQVVIDDEEDIQIKRVLKDGSVSEEEDVVEALTSIENIKTVAYAIDIKKVIDKETGEITTHSIYLDTKKNANAVLAALKEKYSKDIDPKELLEVSLEENVTVDKSKAHLEDILDTPAAIKMIMSGGVKEKIHVVKAGESLASVAEKYGVKWDKLKQWNDSIKDDNIVYVGQKIQLQKKIPLINVVTKRNTIIKEDFFAKTDYTDTDKLYKDQKIVTKKGKSGKRTVNTDIIERNGKQIDRIDHSFVVDKEPVVEEAMRGTKERPDKIGKGYYSMPMDGIHTSPFGARWGRMHNGIDIAGPSGTNVYAADAGVVTEAGATSNGYGITVEISHGNGRTTYYAHNSKVLVKVGDTVYRGQHIAESGNTGYSTGPHLHFETRFGGVPKNPDKYL